MSGLNLELVSDKCVNVPCTNAWRLRRGIDIALGSLGVRRCPGLAADGDGNRVCSLGGEIAEVIARDYPGVPDSLLLGVARGIADGSLALGDLPVAANDPAHTLQQWNDLMRQLDAARDPGQQQS